MTVSSTVHGFPRIGDRRELKTATEGYWAGRVPAEELEATARELRRQTWSFLRDAGIGQVPSNHFSLYDQVLDTCVLVGAVPEPLPAAPAATSTWTPTSPWPGGAPTPPPWR